MLLWQDFDPRLCGKYVIVLTCAWQDSRNSELLEAVVRGKAQLTGAPPGNSSTRWGRCAARTHVYVYAHSILVLPADTGAVL